MLQPEDIFDEARKLDAVARERYLAEACGDDLALRQRIESLLKAESDAGSFLASSGHDEQGDPAAHLESPGRHIDRYKLLERIGEGGFGEVWMAEQTEPVKRRVALKIIKLGMDTRQVIARFEAERQALAMMDHPNIAGVLDAGATQWGRPYFIMELVRGVPLIEYCDSRRLSTQQRLGLFIQVCSALAHAHQKGIIHRDVKPGNVLVTLLDGQPVAKVIDFGIAKATSAELTQKTFFTAHRQMIGTPAYMSPEQAALSGLDVDTRSDVYSLGVLLYELLTGTTPFDTRELLDHGLAEMMRIIREKEPEKPSTRLTLLGDAGTRTAELRGVDARKLALAIRGELDWIVMKCLEKDRRRRYETVQDLAADIRRHLTGEPVVAAPPSRIYLASKFVNRNRFKVLATSVIAAVLLLGIAGTSTGLAWALREQERADAAARRALTAAAQESQARREAESSEQRAREEAQRAVHEAERAASEARRAHAAEEEARIRADELQHVVQFQHSQLAGIRPQAMGAALEQSIVNSRRRAALIHNVPEDAADNLASELAQSLSYVNFTDIALEALHEHIFSRAIETIEHQFTEQPEVKATLLRTVAGTMYELDLLEPALQVQRAALELHRELLGDDHDSTIAVLRMKGVMLRSQGRLREAEPFLREAMEACRRVFGPEHPRTLNAINSLTVLLEAQGRTKEAVPLRAEVLEVSRRTLGDDHMQTLTAQTNKTLNLRRQGRHAEAEELLLDALERLKNVAGPEDRFTLSAMGMLVTVYLEQQKFEEARPLALSRLEITRRVFGDAHSLSIESMEDAAMVFQADGDLEQAESLLRTAVENSRDSLGDGHPLTTQLIVRLSTMLLDQSRWAEAEPLEYLAFAAYAARFGDQSPHAVSMMQRLAFVLENQGKFRQAEPHRRNIVLANRHLHGDDHLVTLQSLSALGLLLKTLDLFEEAEALLQEALSGMRRLHGDEHPTTLSILNNLGMLMDSMKRHDEAERFYRESLQGLRKVHGDLHPHTLSTVGNLGLSILEQGKTEEAEPYLRESLQGCRELFGLDHPRTLNAMNSMALALRELGRLEEAESINREVVASARQLLPPGHTDLASFLSQHAKTLVTMERFADAQAAALESQQIFEAAFGSAHTRTIGASSLLAELYDLWHKKSPDAGHSATAEAWRKRLSDEDAAPNAADPDDLP